MLLVVDGSESLGETDETDNVLAVPIDIALPNLIVSNITAPPTIASGNTVDIGWTVDNTSGHPAGTDWYDYVYLSRDELYGSDDQSLGSQYAGSLTPLAPGDSYSTSGERQVQSHLRRAITSCWSSANGDGRAGRKSDDYDNVLAVAGDDHGARRGGHGVQRAGFGEVQGETVQLSWTVSNASGEVVGTAWSDQVYLSDDETLEIGVGPLA